MDGIKRKYLTKDSNITYSDKTLIIEELNKTLINKDCVNREKRILISIYSEFFNAPSLFFDLKSNYRFHFEFNLHNFVLNREELNGVINFILNSGFKIDLIIKKYYSYPNILIACSKIPLREINSFQNAEFRVLPQKFYYRPIIQLEVSLLIYNVKS